MNLRIREVARKAKVSTATISRVLNDSPLVKPETKKRVKEVIRKLDYQPNVSALRLRQQKVSTIGVVGPRYISYKNDNFYYLYGEIIRGIAIGLGHQDPKYDMLLGRSAEADERAADFIQLHKAGKIGGAVVIFPSKDDPNIAAARETGLPVVYVGIDLPGHSCVDVDNRQGMTELMEYLFKQGHTRIAMLNGRRDQTSYRDRYNAYCDALAGRNLAPDPALYREGMEESRDAHQAALALLEQQPSVIVCATDLFAEGAAAAVREKGLRVPEDILLTGFDGTPGAAVRSLTTVRQPLIDMGTAAVTMLIENMEQESAAPRKTVLPCELLLRRSTGS